MAKIELSVLQRRYLGQRFADQAAIEQSVTAWTGAHNAASQSIDWQFTTTNARIKLRRLYPAFEA